MLMFGSYSVINVIVLLNLLIAMMSNSYNMIHVSFYPPKTTQVPLGGEEPFTPSLVEAEMVMGPAPLPSVSLAVVCVPPLWCVAKAVVCFLLR